jgi:PEP-CTERM motif
VIMKLRIAILSAAAAIVVLVSPATLHAVPIFGDGSSGHFTGSFDYDGTSLVTIVLNNTSPVANGGYITGFVFNIPDVASVSSVVYGTSDSDFLLLGAPSFDDNVKGAPFGWFDIGAALGGDFEGGGSPNDGIDVSSSATFTFTLTGTGLGTLTAADFLSTLSVGPGDGAGDEAFVVRFKGFIEGEDSDKVPAETTPIPEPGSVFLLGAGLTALWARRSRRA